MSFSMNLPPANSIERLEARLFGLHVIKNRLILCYLMNGINKRILLVA